MVKNNKIPLEIVFEAVCGTMMKNCSKIITLKDKNNFVEKCMQCASVEDEVITLHMGKITEKNIVDFPLYNYLVVRNISDWETAIDGHLRIKNERFQIIGFNIFAEVKEFLTPPYGKDGCISVYVRCAKEYKEGLLLFSYQSPDDEKLYVNQYAFYQVNYPYVGFKRHPKTEYFLEIAGLCEIHRPKKVCAFIISSLAELYDYIEYIALKKSVNEYFEEGKVYFNQNLYKYEIIINSDGIYISIQNEKGEYYCCEKYRLCKFYKICDGENVTC